MSVKSRVLTRLKRMKKGKPFWIGKFFDLGTRVAVYNAFSQLVAEGEIVRVANGFYGLQEALELLPGVMVSPSAVETAMAWAKHHGYILTQTSFSSAHQVGFQLQAPARVIFWTSGPSRTFRNGNEEVKVIHKGRSKLLRPGTDDGLVYRATLEFPPGRYGHKCLRAAVNRLKFRTPPEVLLTNLLKLPLSKEWRKSVLSYAKENNIKIG